MGARISIEPSNWDHVRSVGGTWRHKTTQCRGGHVKIFTIDADDFEQQYQESLSDTCTPELLFDRCWVDTLLTNVVSELRADYQKAEKTALFDALSPYLAGGLPRDVIGKQLGMSAEAVAMSLHRMRKRYGEILRRSIADTVAHPDDIEDELSRLMEVVATRQAR